MTKALTIAMGAMALALLAAPAALAQAGQEPLESRLAARKVVVSDGRESFADASTAKPGDVIEYVATYRNTGKDTITGLQATMPIPPHTEFIPGTAGPARARASLDGRDFADIPLKRKSMRDGRQVEEDVPYRDYRYLRWFAADLGGGRTRTFKARVRVIDDRPSGVQGDGTR